MELSDIEKVVNSKRMNTDVENLREKVSRETAKIIKLKVAQDAAYWDLKEKLQQVENNHERLQQNMVEVQMQHEAISGQYQYELRLRPETLNKLSSSREICDVLEDYSERLKETLSRCKADQGALYDAYQKSGQLVREFRHKQEQVDEQNKQQLKSLQEKVALTSEHQSQLLQFFTAAKQQADSELIDMKANLASIQAQKDELLATVENLNRAVDNYKQDLIKKDEMITNLRDEIKRIIEEYNIQIHEARNKIAKQEEEMKETSEACTSLKQALCNQEQFTKSICGERISLKEKVASLEEEQLSLVAAMDELNIKLTDTTTAKENSEQDLAKLINVKKLHGKRNLCLQPGADVNVKVNISSQHLTNSNQQIHELQMKINRLENEKSEVTLELGQAMEDMNQKCRDIEMLIAEKNKVKEKNIEIENDFKTYRETTEDKIKNMITDLQHKDREICSKTDTINILTSEVKTGTDARSKLEGSVQRLKKEMEIEREAAMEKERKLAKHIEQLEHSARDKELEFSKQMSIILKTRSEKEALQGEIQSMRQTIDNIQKELAGRIQQPLGEQPELDDNAVMLTPVRKKSIPRSPTLNKSGFATPRPEPKQVDSPLYALFSDSSMEGDTVDASVVERRFVALSRGERLSPIPLAAFKRRSTRPSKDEPTSLSLVKNDLKNRDRKFFKNKRLDPKVKKFK